MSAALQLTRAGVRLPDAAALEALRREYAERSCVVVRKLLEPALLRRIQARVAATLWRPYRHDLDEPSTELVMSDEEVSGILLLLTLDEALWGAVRAITCCEPIGCFNGRVYRMDANAGHHDVWHGDDDDNRMVTLSINLSPERYEGGVLELRERPTKRMLARVANTGEGDGLLFRIDHDLEHRVTDVEGPTPKIACAGWFQRQPVVNLGRLVRP